MGSRIALGLGEACHPGPTVVVTAITTVLAATVGRSGAGCLAVGAAVLAGQLSVGWSNDAVDAARDRQTQRTDKPIVSGLVPRRVVGAAAGTAVLAAIPLSLLSGWRAAVAHLVAITLAWAYNLGLKATPASVLTYAGAFALLPVFVTLGEPHHPLPPGWVVTGAALLGAGAHLANALPDLDGDLATGVRGLPQRLGADRTRIIAAVLLLAASVTLTLGPPHAVAAVLGSVAVAVALSAVVLWSRRAPALAFRAAMGLAGADVLLLVLGGHSV